MPPNDTHKFVFVREVRKFHVSNFTISDLLAQLGLKAKFVAQLLVALASKSGDQGQGLRHPVALAYVGLQAAISYVFGLRSFQATACMS